MDYLKHYNLLILKAQARIQTASTRMERHHIVPKSLGGNNDHSNIVNLTPREHFIAHWLLHRAYPNNTKLSYAFLKMCNGGNTTQSRYAPSSRVIAEAKLSVRRIPWTEERKQKMQQTREEKGINKRRSLEQRGSNNTMYGKLRKDTSQRNQTNPPGNKPCIINDVEYPSIAVAAKQLSMNKDILRRRIHSSKWPTYQLKSITT